ARRSSPSSSEGMKIYAQRLMSAFGTKRTSESNHLMCRRAPVPRLRRHNQNWPTHALALADSIPQWVLFKMPTIEPTPPINDPLPNAVQLSIHNRLIAGDYRPYRL